MKYLTSSILALVGAAILAPSAQAQVSYTAGDILVGFRNSASNIDYVVDIGSATSLAARTGTSTLISAAALQADLGGSVNGTAAGLTSGTFGAFGETGTGGNAILYGTNFNHTPPTPPTAFGVGTPLNKIATFGATFAQTGTNLPNGQVQGSVANSAYQIISADSNNPSATTNNYTTFLTGGAAFSFFTAAYDGAYSSSGSSDLIDLNAYHAGTSAATTLGQLQIVNGALEFISATPIPEPATLSLGLGLVALVAFRRNRVRLVAA